MIVPQKKGKGALIISAILVVLFSGLFSGYTIYGYLNPSQISAPGALPDEQAGSVDKSLVSSNTEFAFNIFKELSIEDGSKNVFISPLSISIALAMTFNGAEGTTKDAMAKTLQFGNMSLEEINQGYLNLMHSLESADKQVELDIANSIWIRDTFEHKVKTDFTQRVKEFYESEILARDFSDLQTIDEINAWISNKTNGKIDKMIDEIDPEIAMFLINAIYFKGEWITSFNESATKEADFLLSDGSTTKVEMMLTRGNFSYYAGENFTAIRLPYSGNKIAMYVFLPNRDVSLDSFIESLSQETWERYVAGFTPVVGIDVRFPKFKLEYGVKRLNDVLKKLGMSVAFSQSLANFGGMAQDDLYIDYVIHKAVIEVNEKGTEAAAATVVAMAYSSVNPSFIVDRPFFFVIRDDSSGTILFTGKVVNPAET